jgi:HAD superfamily hydrolase (TIGR01450 family)
MKKKRYRGILADLDGTVNRGHELIPGVDATYATLTAQGVRWVFVSNSATLMPAELAEKISRLGIPVSPDQVVNSASALIKSLQQDHPTSRVMVIGEQRLIAGLIGLGFSVTENPEATDIVVVALDSRFTYDKLSRAHWAIERGALFWATNQDPTYPVPKGFIPGAGSIVAAVATAAGRPPDVVFGKPSPHLAPLALEALNLEPDSCIVVGDRMDTDVLFARNAGIDSALVLTGATTRENLSRFAFEPTYVLESINDLTSLMAD